MIMVCWGHGSCAIATLMLSVLDTHFCLEYSSSALSLQLAQNIRENGKRWKFWGKCYFLEKRVAFFPREKCSLSRKICIFTGKDFFCSKCTVYLFKLRSFASVPSWCYAFSADVSHVFHEVDYLTVKTKHLIYLIIWNKNLIRIGLLPVLGEI